MLRASLLSLLLCAPGVAAAQDLHGVADLRLGQAAGERAWTDGGFGKTSLSDDLALDLPRAAVAWTPQLGFSVSAHVAAQFEPDASPKLDLNEVYLAWRGPPAAIGQVSAKLGVFYPPVSLEHSGPAWSLPDTLSASAINTWVGEEVLVGGLELSLRREVAGHELTARGAAFGWNDTAGTLLSFRGWALHGLTTGWRTEWPLPPLSPLMVPRQGPDTYPVLELDNRAGWYGALEWRPPAPVVLTAMHYDNAGNRVAVNSDVQWAWETRFTNLGVRWEPAPDWTVLAQAMSGETLMGYRMGGQIWVDVGFKAAFVSLRRRLGDDALTVRAEAFGATDRTLVALDDNREHGWALTGAWRHRLADHLDLLVEAQHVASTRRARPLAGEAPRQTQTAVQAALRASF